jgi:hypothetical protein
MIAHGLTPILNVTDLPPASPGSKNGLEKMLGLVLCVLRPAPACTSFSLPGRPGSRGRRQRHRISAPRRRIQRQGRLDVRLGKNVDQVHRVRSAGLDVTFPPTDMPWPSAKYTSIIPTMYVASAKACGTKIQLS